MKTEFYFKKSLTLIVILLMTTSLWAQVVPTITGPIDPTTNLPAVLGNGITSGQVYTTEAGMTGYRWVLSPAGRITAGFGTNSIKVTWTYPTGQQTVSVTYAQNTSGTPTVLIINYYPFAAEIDPTKIPQFVDPLPHFAAGLRVNAKNGGNLYIRAVPVRQVAVSTGTVLANGTVGDPSTPDAGKGNYAAYEISKDNFVTPGVPMWPAQTIEAQVGKQLKVKYINNLAGLTYDNFNILSDQTLLQNGYPKNGNIYTDPYRGPIPMVVHLHGGEMPSNSDGGPTAWFMPGYSLLGPGFKFNASSLATYPNNQEAGTLWYHPHDQGNTRTNVYTGLAGFYFLRGPNEEAAKLPGWSGDDKVMEVTPAGKTQTFNGSKTYLPEIEIAIQDRMFNVKGELYWPVTPTNPDKHPFWTPEFFGDIMTVNGKTWPYLSVAPRSYRFRILDGCNARFLNMWLEDMKTGVTAPAIKVIGSDGNLMDAAAAIQILFMAPGERYDVVIDFSNIPAGTVFTLRNSANAPYPDGDPVVPDLTDRIMQFIVNGKMVSAADPTKPGIDKSGTLANLRPLKPMVKLTDFAGKLSTGVKPDVKRQILLNEVATDNGPVQVLFNNSHFDVESRILGAPLEFGGPTETPVEGTTELVSIINTTVDAHPIHVHLTQWQLVSRQQFNVDAYMAAYSAAWAPRNVPEFPAGQGYPGGAGSPNPYNSSNDDGAIGGNPAIKNFLTAGTLTPANPEERVWKDDVKAFPGEVSTFIVRYSPTDKPINATPKQLLYSFDPSLGPGFVWHCHIIDHEDMDMMRPLMIQPSPLRFPQIMLQPKPGIACVGDVETYSVLATSETDIDYQWQVSTDGGVKWTNLNNAPPYAGVLSPLLKINPAALALNNYQYRCNLTNIDGTSTSDAALLTVNNCSVSGNLKYNNTNQSTLAGFTIMINGKSAITDASGAFKINAVTSGIYPVNINATPNLSGGFSNATDAGSVNDWLAARTTIPDVRYLSGDVNSDRVLNKPDASAIQSNFVKDKDYSIPWVYAKATGSGTGIPPSFFITINGESVNGFNILGMLTGDFNSSFSPNANTGISNVILTNTGTVNPVAAGAKFDLPLKSASNLQVEAISLVLNIPSNLVKVTEVKVQGSTIAADFDVHGNELRIGWNSTTPVNVNAGGNLVVITLNPTSSFTTGQTMTLGLIPNNLNELADGNFTPLSNPELTVDKVSAQAPNSGIELSAAPNPTSGSSLITYKLPVAGRVTLGVYTSIGTSVMTPFINNVSMTAGTYTKSVNISSLAKGTYYLTLTLKTSTTTLVKTITFVKN